MPFSERTLFCSLPVMKSTIQRNATKNVQDSYSCYNRAVFGFPHFCREQFFTGDVKIGLQNVLSPAFRSNLVGILSKPVEIFSKNKEKKILNIKRHGTWAILRCTAPLPWVWIWLCSFLRHRFISSSSFSTACQWNITIPDRENNSYRIREIKKKGFGHGNPPSL